jgi:hypothetical protein
VRPALHTVLSGDHLVGYGAVPPVTPVVEHWDGRTRAPVAMPPGTLAASFSAEQMPAWLLLPGLDEKYGHVGLLNGGDHGACVGSAGLSDVDGVVPLMDVGRVPQTWPTRLEGVQQWFLNL